MTPSRVTIPTTGPMFEHEKLDVYAVALDFVAFAHGLIGGFPRGRASLADQLERAATSIVLNTAEGCGEFNRREKARFYRMALRSAAECAAVLDVAQRTGAITSKLDRQGKAMLQRISAMLTALVRHHASQ